MATVKFTITNGKWQISYEGTEEFLTTEFLKVVNQFLEIPVWTQPAIEDTSGEENSNSLALPKTQVQQIPQMTINTMCTKWDCKTGTDLVFVACGYLTFIQNMEQLSRRDITDAMKEAKSYFRDTYVSNLGSSLQTLIKQRRLMEVKQDVYVLTATGSKELKEKIVDA